MRADGRGLVSAKPAHRPSPCPDQDSVARLVAGWQGAPVGERTSQRSSQVRRKKNHGKSRKFLMGKPKFGGVQEVSGAARRHRDALLGLLQTARDTLSPQHAARSCNGRFLCSDHLRERPGGPGRRQWGFRAPSVCRGQGPPNAQHFCRSRRSCGLRRPRGRRSLHVC